LQKNNLMASRRKLKKTIQYVCTELITDIYFRLLINPKAQDQAAESLVLNINLMANDFCLRANRPTGSDNRKLVKTYYRSLYNSWNEKVSQVISEIEKL
jgi:hypothetical protein